MTSHENESVNLVKVVVERASRHPERVAIRYLGDGETVTDTLTYGVLHSSACRVANLLKSRVPPGEPALLVYPGGPSFISAFMGCLYAGVVAIPAFPPESTQIHHLRRLSGIVRDAGTRWLLTNGEFLGLLGPALRVMPELGVLDPIVTDGELPAPAGWQAPDLDRHSLAFLQYTSGSTARPKGVMVGHGNLAANEAAIQEAFEMTEADVVVSWLPLFHDMGLVGGLLQTLFSGASLVLLSPEHFIERPQRWLRAISRFGGTVSGAPDFAYRLCAERVTDAAVRELSLAHWRVAFCGAEPVREATLRQFAARFAPAGFESSALFPCYGLAEATLFVAGGTAGRGATTRGFDPEALSAGRGVATSGGQVIASCGHPRGEHAVIIAEPEGTSPVPAGTVGEILVTGPSIALGYWKDEAATREAFVSADGRRYLRTGDLGFEHEGELFITGRRKDLLIVRGRNVYPQDIEAAVEERCEVVRRGRVAAFSVQSDGHEGIGVVAEVSRRLQKLIRPEAVCAELSEVVAQTTGEPAALVFLLNPGAIPMTSSGKLQRAACALAADRNKLDAFAVWRKGTLVSAPAEPPDAEAVPTLNETGARLAAIWQQTLNVPGVRPEDSFFSLGGNSLRAVEMMTAVSQEFGVTLDARVLFEAQTLIALARRIERALEQAAQTPSQRPIKTPRTPRLVLSRCEERLLSAWMREPASVAYNVACVLRITGDLDVEGLKQALHQLVARHEVLRTRYLHEDSGPYRTIDVSRATALPLVDLSDVPVAEREQRWQSSVASEVTRSFDLGASVFRVLLVQQESRRHDLVVAMHHIAVDGRSVRTLLDELVRLYVAEVRHQEATLPALDFQYADYAAWERSQSANESSGIPLGAIEPVPGAAAPLVLPADQPRSLNPSHRACRARLEMDEATSERVRAFAAARHVTPFVVLHAAFQAILARYCVRERFCVGVPSDHRTHPAFAQLVGFLVDTLPVVADLSSAPSFSELVSRVQASLARAQALRAVPVERVLAALDPNADRSDFLRVTHNHLDAPAQAADEVAGVRFENLGQVYETCPFELTLETAESKGRLEAALLGEQDSFSPTFLDQLGRHYLRLLAAAVASPHVAVEQLNFLSAREEAELWADGALVGSVDAEWQSVGRGVEKQAALTPEGVALACGREVVSYGALNARANQLARYLRRQGVGPENLVGVAGEPSVELGIAMLAIIKAGGAYLPIDTDQPNVRLKAILGDARPPCVLAREEERGKLDSLGVATLGLEEARSAASRESEQNLDVTPSALHPAYCLYTSGSTGIPKGVVVPHGAVQNHMAWMQRAFPLTADDVVLQRTHLGFDAAVWEFWLPLLAGARCVLVPRAVGRDPVALIEALPRLGVSVLQLVPSLLRAMLTSGEAVHALAGLRWLFCGGEALPSELVRQLRGRVRMINLYGPTETTIDATFFECGALDDAARSVPIGSPIANTAGYVLDAYLRPVPRGVTGELFLGGRCLARGYLNRPDVTADRFVPNPASGAGGRLYRTGDRVRRTRRGELEFIGRSDGQVKLRGVRIELGEIEAALRAIPLVRDAAVVVDEARLTGYVVVEPTGEATALADFEAELVRRLSERLPESMVPRAFMVLPKLPLTANCKLDRQALASMRAPRASVAYVSPRNAVEQALAGVFTKVLGLERVGASDDFFALGGDSIVAMQVVSEARRLGVGIEAKDVFHHATVEALARQARSIKVTSPRATPVGDVPLTPIQSWFFERRFREAQHWHQRLWLESTDDALDPVILARAVRAVIEHHDVFRLRFQRDSRGWRQFYATDAVEPYLQRLERLPHESFEDSLARARDLAVGAVDFERGPLLAVVQLDHEQRSRLLVVVHHLVVDAVSLRILVEDLGRAYRDLLESKPVSLLPAAASYQDWANGLVGYSRSKGVQEQLPQWREVVSKQDARLLPMVEASEAPGSVRATLEHASTARWLYESSERFAARPHEVIMTALAAALCREAQRDDVVITVEGHGRAGATLGLDVTRTVGWFTARTPLHLVPDVDDLPKAIRDTRARLAELADDGVGYGALRYLGGEARGLDRREPQVAFNYLGTLHETAGSQASFRLVDEPSGSRLDEETGADDWLEVLAWVRGGRLHLEARLGAALASAAVERVLVDCVQQLRTLFDHPRSREVSMGDVEDVYPLTPVQEGILYHSLLAPDLRVYINQRACTLRTSLDVERLRQAWNRVAARHEPLRTRFAWEGLPRPLQVVCRNLEVPFEQEDSSGLPTDARETAIAAYLERDRERGFDLTSAPLFRVGIVRLDSACFLLRWTEHHLLFDGWSSTRLVSEVLREYTAPGQRVPASESRPARYRDYVEWLLQRDQAKSREFWAATLRGFEATTVLAEHVPKSNDRGRGFLRLSLGSAVDRRAREFARRHRVTLNTLLQGAVALSISPYVRVRDIVFGVTTSGRDAGGLELGLGLFLHTLPLRTRIEPQRSVVDWLQALQRSNLAMREHETLPLAEIQRLSSVPPGQALFDVLLVFENYPADAFLEQVRDMLGASDLRSWESTNYPLTLTVFPVPELSVELTYDKAVLSDSVVRDFSRGVERALAAIAEADDRRVLDLLPLVKGDPNGLYRSWNATERPYPADCICGAFEAQAQRTPAATAVVFEGRTLSYAELNQQANAVASELQRAGVAVDDLVGICAERCLELVPCLLGILKAGAGYLPLDPDLPRDRLEGMLEETRAKVVLAGDAQRQAFGVRAWSLERTVIEQGHAYSRESSAVAPGNVACCLYTSGSTGRPKGVLSTHGGLWNRLCWMQEQYPLTPRDVVLQKTPFGFDVSVWEFFWPLIAGARLVLLPPGAHRDPSATAAVIQREAVTVLHFVPSMLNAFIGAGALPGCHSIRRVVCSGEVLGAELVEKFRREHPAKLCNLYGPTEASIDVSAWECTPAPERRWPSIPIGTAIANTQLYVVDLDLALVPPGRIGELCIAGVALARGYVSRPELSAERFIPNPFGDALGERLYRTGDLVRVTSDGVFEFLGREDQQVKIRGCRIELGEIEAQLTELTNVQEAVVVARRQAGGEPELWAYLVVCADVSLEDLGAAARRQLESSWIASLRRVLPEYMIPQGWILLDRLPRTASGKLDRGQLPVGASRDASRGEPPSNETERQLAVIWQELLGCESVLRNDDFMGLGGHSLLVTRLTTRLRAEFGVDISLRALFEARTLSAMAELIERAPARPLVTDQLERMSALLKSLEQDP